MKADQVVSKYKLLSGEYQNQSKSFKQKHEEIKGAEIQKRKDIKSNFENHFNSI